MKAARPQTLSAYLAPLLVAVLLCTGWAYGAETGIETDEPVDSLLVYRLTDSGDQTTANQPRSTTVKDHAGYLVSFPRLPERCLRTHSPYPSLQPVRGPPRLG